MNVREALEKILEEENIDNVSLNEKSFIVYFGDILNTETETGNQYYLLGTYIEIPYNLEVNQVRLHREIVNEFETGGERDNYGYSGFVHYSGSNFCWGGCNIDKILSEARIDDEFTTDTFHKLLFHFDTYLSTSSHDSAGRTTSYKKLDLTNREESQYFVTKTKTINDYTYPFELTEVVKTIVTNDINYDLPYKRVITEDTQKSFTYKGNTIIPKIVEHFTKEKFTVDVKKHYVDISTIFTIIEETKITKIKNEINNKPRITFQDLLHKLTDTQCRVDGGIYIQN